jgi:protein-tyrosine phosphatase
MPGSARSPVRHREHMKILLVCLGNICRSPMAEGLLRNMATSRGLALTTDSAGMIGTHAGEAPDPRAQAAMRKHGHDISDLRARPFEPYDFERFDLLLAMDASNLRDMLKLAPTPELAEKAHSVMDYATKHAEREVPDPYWGNAKDYEHVYELLNDALEGVINDVERRS